MTQPLVIDQLEELLQEEVPCAGIKHSVIGRQCSNAAVLITKGHGCPIRNRVKCLACWQVWYQYHAGRLATNGGLRCTDGGRGGCRRWFPSVEAFSDYRPF